MDILSMAIFPQRRILTKLLPFLSVSNFAVEVIHGDVEIIAHLIDGHAEMLLDFSE